MSNLLGPNLHLWNIHTSTIHYCVGLNSRTLFPTQPDAKDKFNNLHLRWYWMIPVNIGCDCPLPCRQLGAIHLTIWAENLNTYLDSVNNCVLYLVYILKLHLMINMKDYMWHMPILSWVNFKLRGKTLSCNPHTWSVIALILMVTDSRWAL